MQVVGRSDRTRVEEYVGGLAHVHTRLSNHPEHYESDQTVGELVKALVEHGLAGHRSSPLQFVMVNDHVSNPARPVIVKPGSFRARKLGRRHWETEEQGVPVFYGFEASLMPDGRTDLPIDLAEQCELVIGSCHAVPDEVERNSSALQKLFELACDNPTVGVLGHPARHIEGLSGMDWPRLFRRAAATGTAIEVNVNTYPDEWQEPARTRFWSRWLKELAESGADVFVGSDLHNAWQRERFLADWKRVAQPGASLLAACVRGVATAGIGPERVVNANLRRFEAWLALDKRERSVHTRVLAAKGEAAGGRERSGSRASVLAQRVA